MPWGMALKEGHTSDKTTMPISPYHGSHSQTLFYLKNQLFRGLGFSLKIQLLSA